MESTIADVFGLKAPPPYKSKNSPDKTTNNDLMIGIELEVENLPHGHEWYMTEAGRFWSVVEDGSLRPRGLSWEFVSKPADLGTAMAELRFLLGKMKWDDRNYSDRCSVHVHTNVLNFTQQQVANLALVYPVMEAVLFRFINHYKKKEEQGYCRDTNLYCIPWSDCRMNRNFIEKFFSNPAVFQPDRRGLGVRQWEKYTALNFSPISNKGTVEWRHMHGTADMEKLSLWLNIIGAIMKFCKEQEFNDIVKSIKILNDISTYQQFFTAVLGGVLDYKDEYRVPMAEGVVNAKYSLINWEANKDKVKKTPNRFFNYDLDLNAMQVPEDEGLARDDAPRGVAGWAAEARAAARVVRLEDGLVGLQNPAEEVGLEAAAARFQFARNAFPEIARTRTGTIRPQEADRAVRPTGRGLRPR